MYSRFAKVDQGDQESRSKRYKAFAVCFFQIISFSFRTTVSQHFQTALQFISMCFREADWAADSASSISCSSAGSRPLRQDSSPPISKRKRSLHRFPDINSTVLHVFPKQKRKNRRCDKRPDLRAGVRVSQSNTNRKGKNMSQADNAWFPDST